MKSLTISALLFTFCFYVPTSFADSSPVSEVSSSGYPFSFLGTVIVALIGLIGGIIGSVFAPWVNWWVEKHRLKHSRKQELIKEWRAFIENFDYENENFGNSTVYGAMRPYMNEEIIKKFEAQRTIHVPPDGGRGEMLSKQWAADQVTMIEKKWNLI